MCLILYSPSVGKIPQRWLTNSNSSNPHGIGVIWRDENGLNLKKGMRYGELLFLMDKLERKNPDTPIAIHFRFATHGGKTAELTHPFVIEKENVDLDVVSSNKNIMMHNGVVSNLALSEVMHYAGVPEERQKQLFSLMHSTGQDSYSDTKVLAETLAYVGVQQQKAILYAIAKNESSKFLIWEPEAEQPDLFSSAFTNRDGIWLSNTYSVENSYKSTYYSANSYVAPKSTTSTSTANNSNYYKEGAYEAVSNEIGKKKDEVTFKYKSDQISLSEIAEDNSCDICVQQRESEVTLHDGQDVALCGDCARICGFLKTANNTH